MNSGGVFFFVEYWCYNPEVMDPQICQRGRLLSPSFEDFVLLSYLWIAVDVSTSPKIKLRKDIVVRPRRWYDMVILDSIFSESIRILRLSYFR